MQVVYERCCGLCAHHRDQWPDAASYSYLLDHNRWPARTSGLVREHERHRRGSGVNGCVLEGSASLRGKVPQNSESIA